ncbi:uncharacterized protein LOC113562010 [Ooceraea biroi]|uniref:uncharacterized protein LOC113562010 n=1 Tax=Ooceraea biroi TaxID=2015173 RepID=UPI000F08E0B5|nr:uncharacterized protein LOC113562010 [Ooceraea biroi]
MPTERSPSRTQTDGGEAVTRLLDAELEAGTSVQGAGSLQVRDSNQVQTIVSATNAVRLPVFWKDNAVLWFAQVEAAFAINRIASDESKFRYVILYTDQTVLPLVADLLVNPPACNKYQTLKERICSVLGETNATKIRRLLGSHELGDEKPSIFLQRLRNLAVGQVTDEILKTIFMEQLPENVRTILAISEVQDLQKLAAQADKVMEVTRPTVSAVQVASAEQKGPDSHILNEIAELKKQVKKLILRGRQRSYSRGRSRFARKRSRSRGEDDCNSEDNSNETEYCYYHRKFGDKSWKCRQPCSWKKPIRESEN